MMARLSNLLRRLKSVGVGGGESTTYSGTATDPGYPRQAHIAEILDHHRQGIFECGCGTPTSSLTWNWHVASVIDQMLAADERIEAHRQHVHVNPQGAQQ